VADLAPIEVRSSTTRSSPTSTDIYASRRTDEIILYVTPPSVNEKLIASWRAVG